MRAMLFPQLRANSAQIILKAAMLLVIHAYTQLYNIRERNRMSQNEKKKRKKESNKASEKRKKL